ncbi:MAG: segregation/condensation protein A [Actinomycetota bacterium]|nr:segregation/condensation protein A [Actinomycetota bacterium]
MPYEVHTAVYDGPFDLLLHLIVRDQVDVYQVSLSRIVDAYLTEIEVMGALDLESTTEFLLIAATLVELKTRRLLPGLDDPETEEELAFLEERDLLLARLLECKTFRDAGTALARLAVGASRSRPRTAGLEERFLSLVPDVLAGVTAEDLRSAYLRATQPKPVPRVDLDHVAPIRVSVADAVVELTGVLPALGPVTFRRLTRGIASRLDVIVRFLAVLELYKQGRVEVDQAGSFGDLTVMWTGDGEDAAITSDTDSREVSVGG